MIFAYIRDTLLTSNHGMRRFKVIFYVLKSIFINTKSRNKLIIDGHIYVPSIKRYDSASKKKLCKISKVYRLLLKKYVKQYIFLKCSFR